MIHASRIECYFDLDVFPIVLTDKCVVVLVVGGDGKASFLTLRVPAHEELIDLSVDRIDVP